MKVLARLAALLRLSTGAAGTASAGNFGDHVEQRPHRRWDHRH